MNKSGQIDTVMSWIVFAFYVVILVFLAGILCDCGTDCNRSEKIDTETGGFANLRASEQLSAYLRAEIPEWAELLEDSGEPEEIAMIRERTCENVGGSKRGIIFESDIGELEDVKDFLKNHPDVYIDATYGEFISKIYKYRRDDDAKKTFNIVTKALFNRFLLSKDFGGLPDPANSEEPLKYYFTPTIDVFLEPKKNYHLIGADWRSEQPSCRRDPILRTKRPVTPEIRKYSGEGLKILPTENGGVVIVRMKLHSEKEMLLR